jgi:hypothetical protein
VKKYYVSQPVEKNFVINVLPESYCRKKEPLGVPLAAVNLSMWEENIVRTKTVNGSVK